MRPDERFIILSLAPKFTYKHYRTLCDQTINLDDFIQSPDTYQDRLFIAQETREYLKNKRYLPELEKIAAWQDKSDKHRIIHLESPNYPERLKHISVPPFLLYASGETALLNKPQLAIVGARKHSIYGEEILNFMIRPLVEHSLVITSGMARGIDAIAQQKTITSQGKTIAVLGTGIDICYPYQNKKLYHLIEQQGLLISEFPLKTPPKRHHFPQRNRIISGLALGVLVVEAAKRSGSLITAFHALEQNREVFAVPGNIFHPESEACHQLIQMGAKLVTQAQHIFDELNLTQGLTTGKQPEKANPPPVMKKLSEKQKIVYGVILSATTSIDEIITHTDLTYTEITGILFNLEVDHALIRTVPGGYRRV